MGLLGECEVVGEGSGVLLVHVDGDLVEAGDERMLRPVHEELGDQHEDAVGRQGPETI